MLDDDDKPRIKGAGHAGGGEISPNERGKKRRGGRLPGTPNKMTRILKDALIIAAEAAGAPKIECDPETGRIISAEPGPGGLHGYLLHAALYHPKAFLNMLGKVMPYQVNMKTEIAEPRVYASVEEVRKEIIKRGLDKLLKPDVIVPMKRKN